MKSIMRTITLSVGIIIAASVAYAATEFKFESGDCDNGNRWWSVSEFNGGQLFQISGIDCDGKPYVRYPQRERVASDPTAGTTPTFTGENWHASIRYDELHRIVWAGGQDVNGNFWVTTGITYDESGASRQQRDQNVVPGEDGNR